MKRFLSLQKFTLTEVPLVCFDHVNVCFSVLPLNFEKFFQLLPPSLGKIEDDEPDDDADENQH